MWGIIVLEIIGDILLFALNIWTAKDEPENLQNTLVMWGQSLTRLATLFYALFELWKVEEEEVYEEQGKRELVHVPRISRIIAFTILFSVLPTSDVFTLLSYVLADIYESKNISNATIFVSSYFLMIDVISFLWSLASSIVFILIQGKSSPSERRKKTKKYSGGYAMNVNNDPFKNTNNMLRHRNDFSFV
jgi:hypothetical protein